MTFDFKRFLRDLQESDLISTEKQDIGLETRNELSYFTDTAGYFIERMSLSVVLILKL